MITIKENGMVDARELHKFVEVKTHFRGWIEDMIDHADLVEGKDFRTFLGISIGGRPPVEYDLTIDSAKEICMLAKNEKGKELRRWLIQLSNQRENLDLITVKEAAYAIKVINCLKYVENQVEAYKMHQTSFINSNQPSKYIYAEFAVYRSKIIGWDKQMVNDAVKKYIKENISYASPKLLDANMQTQLSAIDTGEAIRVAVLDVLYSKGNDIEIADKFSTLCKKLANELEIRPDKKNLDTLYHSKENIENISKIGLK